MTDLVFATQSGTPLPVTGAGLEATLENEFDGWRCRRITGSLAPLYAHCGDRVLQLQNVADDWFAPSADDAVPRGAGLVTIFPKPQATRGLRPWLRVLPANMTPEHYEVILSDLKSLAFGVSLYTHPLVKTRPRPSRDGSPTSSLLEHWLAVAQAAATCADTLLQQVPIISQNPSRGLRTQITTMSRARAIRLGAASQVARMPEHRRSVRVACLTETDRMPEKQFVAWVAAQLQDDLALMATEISARLAMWTHVLESAAADRQRLGLQTGPGRAGNELPRLVQEAEQLVERMSTARHDLASVADLARGRSVPVMTNRLFLSKEYGPVAEAWVSYRDDSGLGWSSDDGGLRLTEEGVENTPTLYEMWVTLKLYEGLVARGFHPPAGEQSLLDLLSVGSGTVRLRRKKREQPLVLEREVDGQLLVVRLHHERYLQQHNIAPDLVLEVMYAGTELVWVFDAKYKDYSLPAPRYESTLEERFGSHHRADLAGVAEEKYRRVLEAQVGGIIHSDLSPAFTTWDDDARPSNAKRCTAAASPHTTISIGLLPGEDGEHTLTKLFRLLFAYHLGAVSTCWSCGGTGKQLADGAARTHGTPFECILCGSVWVQHSCRNCKSTLLKFGAESFHRVDPDDPSAVYCPACGECSRLTWTWQAAAGE
jgi:PD-(D/E)XK nuclease superfamily